jgi:hypothetical protein
MREFLYSDDMAEACLHLMELLDVSRLTALAYRDFLGHSVQSPVMP